MSPSLFTTQIAPDLELLKDDLRPVVFEEVRRQVDDEMRCLLTNLKAMAAAEAAALSGMPLAGAPAGKKKKKQKGGNKAEGSTPKRGASEAAEGGGKKKTAGSGKKGGSKSNKDPTVCRLLPPQTGRGGVFLGLVPLCVACVVPPQHYISVHTVLDSMQPPTLMLSRALPSPTDPSTTTTATPPDHALAG